MFAIAERSDLRGPAWSRHLVCPTCGERHDPKNRWLQVSYQREGYSRVDDC
jgi:hypothetical protein